MTSYTTTKAWTYTLDQGLADHLTAGQHVTATLTVPLSVVTATHPPIATLSPYTTLFRSTASAAEDTAVTEAGGLANAIAGDPSASGQLTVHDVDTGEIDLANV